MKVNGSFGGTCDLHLQGGRVSQGRNRPEASCKLSSADSLKRRLTFDGLYGVVFQKIELFITSAVRTSNPTLLILSKQVSQRQTGQFAKVGTFYIANKPKFRPKFQGLSILLFVGQSLVLRM
jgi:hypothetical protein